MMVEGHTVAGTFIMRSNDFFVSMKQLAAAAEHKVYPDKNAPLSDDEHELTSLVSKNVDIPQNDQLVHVFVYLVQMGQAATEWIEMKARSSGRGFSTPTYPHFFLMEWAGIRAAQFYKLLTNNESMPTLEHEHSASRLDNFVHVSNKGLAALKRYYIRRRKSFSEGS